MANWTIDVEPRGETYEALIRFASSKRAVAGLVDQGFTGNDCFLNFMSEFAGHVISVEETFEWPGTVQGHGNIELSRERPKFYKFQLETNSIRLLTTCSSGMYDWISPNLPEDLSFFDLQGEPWMTTIAHERDAFFTLAPDGLNDILKAVSGLVGHWDNNLIC